MQITLDIPDALTQCNPSPADWLKEFAIALFRQNILPLEQAAQVIGMDVDNFYQVLVDRGIATPPSDPDDTPEELILAHLRISLQEVKAGQLKPIAELWDEMDD